MAEYIDREELIARIEKEMGTCNSGFTYNVLKYLKNSLPPIADVVGVKHGEWKLKSQIHQMFDDIDEEFYVECSLCQRTQWVPFEFNEDEMIKYAKEKYPYCNCGAKMDGGEK